MLQITTSEINIGQELQGLNSTGVPIQTNLGTLIGSFLGVMILVGAIGAFLYMVMGGVQWITAGGDTGKIDKARQKIVQSIVGLGVLASTFAIFLVVQYFFGINILATGGGTGGGGGTPRSGSAGSGSTGGVRCEIGRTYSDGGAGGYCTTGSAVVKCFGPGGGASGFGYTHYEPCSCETAGAEKPGVDFSSC